MAKKATVEVFYADDAALMLGGFGRAMKVPADWRSRYKHVATYKSRDFPSCRDFPSFGASLHCEDAYRIMQNDIITDSWTLEPPKELTVHVEPIRRDGKVYGHRSACVGDIFVVNGTHVFVCSSIGFEPVVAADEVSK